MTDEHVDYVVIGAGAAGCVLAHRLTEDPDVSVLLLEAGDRWLPAAVDDARAWVTLLGSTIDWGYWSRPQPALGGRVTYEPRGRALGGSSDLYIMMHVRGHRDDFDGWAAAGAAGWSWDDLAPYFERSECLEADAGGPDRGRKGPQVVTDAGAHAPNPLSRTFIDACVQLGHRELPGFNGPDMLGAAWHELDVVEGRRRGALASYLEPVLDRRNLLVRANALVTRLETEAGPDGRRCTGVVYRQGAPAVRDGDGRLVGRDGGEPPGERRVTAREVLVCAGAIESPKLLMLSGIGPSAHLREVGVEPVLDLPGVGTNFHNHVLTGVIAETVEPVAPPTQNLSESALFLGPVPGGAPDLQMAFVHAPFDIVVGRAHPNAVSILPGVVRPRSRGTVRLADPDPAVPPAVDPNYLGDPADADRLVEGVRLARQIFAAPAFADVLAGELMPGPDVTSDELAGFVRDRADSYHHQAGSCRMGADAMAVVDHRLRVRGVTGVRVVDASVMPAVTSGNPHAAIVAVAERAADLIRGDRRATGD